MNLNKRDLIKTIKIEPSNFEYCANNKVINGTLLNEIERVMQIYSNNQLDKSVNLMSKLDIMIDELYSIEDKKIGKDILLIRLNELKEIYDGS